MAQGTLAQQTGGAGKATAHHAPEIEVTFEPRAKVFYIDASASMPSITAVCALREPINVPALKYDWTASLTLNPAGVPHAVGRVTTHSEMKATTDQPRFVIPFRQVRGGTLKVTVVVSAGGKMLTGTASVPVLGTNPSSALLRALATPELLLKLMTAESSLRQFLSTGTKAGYPLFSQDNLGGVGLGQITRPRPTDDEVWDWKANARASVQLFHEKQSTARAYFNNYASGTEFKKLVAAYNELRVAGALPAAPQIPSGLGRVLRAGGTSPSVPGSAAAVPSAPPGPLAITMPASTDAMLENETIRLYNGEPVHLHEYIPLLNNGVLVVHESPDGKHGAGEWHQVTAEERKAYYREHNLAEKRWGDVNYVEDVQKKVVP